MSQKFLSDFVLLLFALPLPSEASVEDESPLRQALHKHMVKESPSQRGFTA